MDYGNTTTPGMYCRLGSATLSQLAFPRESNPNFSWEKSHWDSKKFKKKKKKKEKQPQKNWAWSFTQSSWIDEHWPLHRHAYFFHMNHLKPKQQTNPIPHPTQKKEEEKSRTIKNFYNSVVWMYISNITYKTLHSSQFVQPHLISLIID